MLYREIIAVCSEIQTKHMNTAVWAESEATIFCHELSNQQINLFPTYWWTLQCYSMRLYFTVYS